MHVVYLVYFISSSIQSLPCFVPLPRDPHRCFRAPWKLTGKSTVHQTSPSLFFSKEYGPIYHQRVANQVELTYHLPSHNREPEAALAATSLRRCNYEQLSFCFPYLSRYNICKVNYTQSGATLHSPMNSWNRQVTIVVCSAEVEASKSSSMLLSRL